MGRGSGALKGLTLELFICCIVFMFELTPTPLPPPFTPPQTFTASITGAASSDYKFMRPVPPVAAPFPSSVIRQHDVHSAMPVHSTSVRIPLKNGLPYIFSADRLINNLFTLVQASLTL